jgi:hypothetical protein
MEKQFDFSGVYDQLIEEGGKSRTLFVNGGPSAGGLATIVESFELLGESLNLPDAEYIPGEDAHNGSVWYDLATNPNEAIFSLEFVKIFLESVKESVLKEIQKRINEVSNNLQQAASEVRDIGDAIVDLTGTIRDLLDVDGIVDTFVDTLRVLEASFDVAEEIQESFQASLDVVTSVKDFFDGLPIEDIPNALESNETLQDYIKYDVQLETDFRSALSADLSDLAIRYFSENTSASTETTQYWLAGENGAFDWLSQKAFEKLWASFPRVVRQACEA